MRRFFVDSIPETGSEYIIRGKEARHLSLVLRMGMGERIVLIDSQGYRFQALIRETSTAMVRVYVEEALPAPVPSPVEITLCQSLIKSKAMDLVIQKASELGVDRIIPFTCERTIVKFDKKKGREKQSHWTEIGRSAATQCDRARPAVIEEPLAFAEMIDMFEREKALKVMMWEQEEGDSIKDLLKSSEGKDCFIGMVGPEGGFSKKEVSLAEKSGFVSASLGPRILRAETAGITLVALVQYEWGDLGIAERSLN